VPTFSGIPFAGWTLVTAGVAAYAARIQGSRPYAPIESGQRAAQYRTACWRLILILLPQDCHRTRPGCERRREGLLHTLARERGRFRKRRCRASTLPLQRSSWNQVNGALRADDIVHEAEGMRSNATAAYSRTPCLRDHRMRHGERILVVADSLPAGRNDRRFAARLQPGAGRSGRVAQDVDWPHNARSTARLCPSITATERASYDDNGGRTLRSRCSTSLLA
jgi:hypothetical protein